MNKIIGALMAKRKRITREMQKRHKKKQIQKREKRQRKRVLKTKQLKLKKSERMQKRQEPVYEGNIEVTGLVSVEYDSKRNAKFHAEMLFLWWGKTGYNEGKLLDIATEILIDRLPELERIPFELVSEVAPDFSRRGIELERAYFGIRKNEMDYEIFVPTAGGRVLTTGTMMVVA